MTRSELAKVQELLKQVSEYENGIALFKTSTGQWELHAPNNGYATFIPRDAAKKFIEAQLKETWETLRNLGVYPDPVKEAVPPPLSKVS